MKKFLFYLLLLSLITFSFSLGGVPKYTDKETALKLANILDEATFGRYTITSTYVQNDNVSSYYISVILSDGNAEKWYINQIYKWCRDDRLTLRGNRTLLFLDPRDSHFVVLDKNKFHRLAIKATVFLKRFPEGDPLFGKQFRFRVKTFSLISPAETAFGRHDNGSKYRYIIDLYNGTRELLTYEQAYIAQREHLLLEEKTFSAPTFERAYHVTRITPQSKEPSENGVSQFGIEIQFSRPIKLTGDQLPYVIYERKRYNRRTKRYKKEFVLDVTIPNSEERYAVKPIRNHEYLHNIKIVKDPIHPKRLILRASFNPTVIDLPPIVYKNGENSVFVNFFNLVDQSVLSRGMLLEAKKRREAERKSYKTIRITKIIKEDSDFNRAFITATETHKKSQTIKGVVPRIKQLLESIKQFEAAALLTKKDSQLYSALSQRNRLRNIVIVLSLDYAKRKLSEEEVENSDVNEITTLLDQAESFTRNQQMLRTIDRLREKLNTYQRR